jgi:uridine kinase
VELAMGRAPTLGAGRLVCVDGPAGSGKTTWASGIAGGFDRLDHREGARVVHMDDLYPGWSGLAEVDDRLAGLLLPLAEGRAGSYRRYDWVAGRFAEAVEVEPVPLLVLEGVGSGASRFASLMTVLVWVEAPYDLRMRRGLDRDGDAFAPHWEQWARDEADLFARERTRERADVVVDSTAPYPGESISR